MKIVLTFCLAVSLTLLANAQSKNLVIEGSDDQIGVIHTTSSGNSYSGLDLLRVSEFSGTDWRIVNEGGLFKLKTGLDNFMTNGTDNLIMSESGRLQLLEGSESSIGNDSGVLMLGKKDGPNLSLDQNEILARNGERTADLFLQAGNPAGNTYLNIANGHVGIGSSIAPVQLTVSEGSETDLRGGGYLLLGYENSQNLVFDNNEIQSRNGERGSDLILQQESDGNIGIGTTSTLGKVTIEDPHVQFQLRSSSNEFSSWYFSATSGDALVISTQASPSSAFLSLDEGNNVIDVNNHRISEVDDPVNATDAVNLRFLQDFGGSSPNELSNLQSNMTLVECATHCRTLTEDDHSDWSIPNLDEASHFIGITNSNQTIWTSQSLTITYAYDQHNGGAIDDHPPTTEFRYEYGTVNLLNGGISPADITSVRGCRCVR